jgi:hypothetical protein
MDKDAINLADQAQFQAKFLAGIKHKLFKYFS